MSRSRGRAVAGAVLWLVAAAGTAAAGAAAASATAPAGSAAAPVAVGEFSSGRLDGWAEKRFAGATRYALVEVDGRRVLEARSEGAASGLVREVSVDLERTPYLTWTWRVETTLDGLEETTKAGDDYPARLYVIVSGGAFFWRTRTLSYVWSSGLAAGASWPNAFAPDNATMVAVQSGRARVGEWVTQTRDVADDLRRHLGMARPRVDAVAIMTDTDNSGRRAVAYYGDIRFEPAPPAGAQAAP